MTDGAGVVYAGIVESDGSGKVRLRFKMPEDAAETQYRILFGFDGNLNEAEFSYVKPDFSNVDFPQGNARLSASAELDSRTVSISGETEPGNVVTCVVLKPEADAEEYGENDICYAGQCKGDLDGLFGLSFDMDHYSETGNYTVLVSCNGASAGVTDFYHFTGFREASEFVNKINGALSADEVYNILEENDIASILGNLGCNYPDYLALPDDGRSKAAVKIFNDGEDYTDEDKMYESFKGRFNEAVILENVRSIAAADELEAYLKKCSGQTGLDFSENSIIAGTSEERRGIIFSTLLGGEFDTLEDLAYGVNEKIMIGLLKTANYSAVGGILDYYRPLLKLELHNYDAFDDKVYLDKLIVSDEYTRRYSNAEELLAAVETAISSYKPNKNFGSSGSGGGGGGGSAGSSLRLPENNKPLADNDSDNSKPEAVFSDMTGFEWADKAVSELHRLGIISGVDDTHFAPQKTVKREEFVKMCVNAFGLTSDAYLMNFADLDEKAWYYPYISAAFNNGVICGISDTRFGIGMEITRQDMAVIISRLIGEDEKPAVLFDDDDQIASYAGKSVYSMRNKGIITGRDNNCFAPTDYASRAEAAVIIYNCINLNSDKQYLSENL